MGDCRSASGTRPQMNPTVSVDWV